MARGPDRRRRRTRRPVPRPVSDRRREEDKRAFIIMALAVLVIAGLGMLFWGSRSPALDQATGCVRGDLTPPAHTVVLIDQTDHLTVRQIDYVKVLIMAEYERLRPGAKMTVRSITADPDSTAREFARCRVRRGAEVSEVTQNPEMIEADFRRIVGDRLNNYLDGLANAPTAEASPILETVASVVDGADFGPTVQDRRLVIVSDMAQHSAALNQYAQPGVYDPAPGAREVFGRDLENVRVRVHYVRRPELARMQTESHRAFWRGWFQQADADVQLGWGMQMVDGAESARRR